jgi:hypothetical protein
MAQTIAAAVLTLVLALASLTLMPAVFGGNRGDFKPGPVPS